MNNPYAISSNIYLRAPTLQDAEGSWHEWFSDPETTKYLGDRYLPNSKEKQIAFFQSLQDSNDRVVFSICKIENDEHIGVCGLSAINWFHSNADISYVIGNKQSNNANIITEAVSLLLESAFNRMNLLNLRSAHAGSNPVTPLIDKMFGFKVIGKLDDYIICDGKRDDLIISQLSKEDWLTRNKRSL